VFVAIALVFALLLAVGTDPPEGPKPYEPKRRARQLRRAARALFRF
jgi:hypothetical protein